MSSDYGSALENGQGLDSVKPGEPALVIFVHGTFAASDSKVGKEWWQLESEFARGLTSGCEHRLLVADPHQWIGNNSEAARRAAARLLCKRLTQLEKSGTPYHLVKLINVSHAFESLVNKIVIQTSKMRETPMSWDALMYEMFQVCGHMGLRQKYVEGSAGEHCTRYMVYLDSTSLLDEAKISMEKKMLWRRASI